MEYFIQTYLVVLIEIMSYKIFFETFCKRKAGKNKVKIDISILLSIPISLLVFIFENVYIIKEILIIVVMTLIMKWYNQESLKKNFALTMICQSIVLAVDYITIVVFTEIFAEIDMTVYLVQILMVFVSKTVLFLVMVLIKKIFDKKDMEYFGESQWIQFLFFPVFTIGVISIMLSNISTVREEQNKLFWLIAFGLTGMNIVVFYLLRDIGLREKNLHEKEVFEIQANNQLKLYETILKNTQKQRKMTHEYKNQIECIQTLCETEKYEELKEYIRDVTGKVRHDLDHINCNHPIINAVLNAKYQEAAEKGIVVVYKINDMSKIELESKDIVVLLSNLLNNAIEACEKCSGDKYIKLKLVHENNNLIIAVKNTYDGNIECQNGVLRTTKRTEMEEHGIGIQNVIQIIEKNQGYHIIKPMKSEFYISIIIPQSSM